MVNTNTIKGLEDAKKATYNGKPLTDKEKKVFDSSWLKGQKLDQIIRAAWLLDNVSVKLKEGEKERSKLEKEIQEKEKQIANLSPSSDRRKKLESEVEGLRSKKEEIEKRSEEEAKEGYKSLWKQVNEQLKTTREELRKAKSDHMDKINKKNESNPINDFKKNFGKVFKSSKKDKDKVSENPLESSEENYLENLNDLLNYEKKIFKYRDNDEESREKLNQKKNKLMKLTPPKLAGGLEIIYELHEYSIQLEKKAGSAEEIVKVSNTYYQGIHTQGNVNIGGGFKMEQAKIEVGVNKP